MYTKRKCLQLQQKMGAKRRESLFSNISQKNYLSKLNFFFKSHLSLVNTNRGVGNFFITDFTSFLHLLVHRLDVLVQVTHSQCFTTVRALSTLIVMNLINQSINQSTNQPTSQSINPHQSKK